MKLLLTQHTTTNTKDVASTNQERSYQFAEMVATTGFENFVYRWWLGRGGTPWWHAYRLEVMISQRKGPETSAGPIWRGYETDAKCTGC
jgi:hypothetical protein